LLLEVYDPSAGVFREFAEFNQSVESWYHPLNLTEFYENPTSIGEILNEALPDLEGKVYAFYYPWYGNQKGPTGYWMHWEDVTEDTIYGITNFPTLGPYDSRDKEVVLAQIAMAKEAGIDGFIASWWGTETNTAQNIHTILEAAEETGFQVSVYHESYRELSEDDIVEEFIYIINEYADSPAFMKDQGRPIIYVYAVPVDDRFSEFWMNVRGVSRLRWALL
jgi:hypothetical protein